MNIQTLPDEEALVAAYAKPVPRYTSYPTAPHFHEGIGAKEYAGWLSDLAPDLPLSLYFHIPYCDTLCWFCGCHTKITRKYEPVSSYLDTLCQEIGLVREHLGDTSSVRSIHWGGGSPTLLNPADTERLAGAIRDRFDVRDDAEFAIEIDPRDFDRERVDALARAGVTRTSIGVQDFDPKVQTAINRIQSFEETARVIEWLRGAGIERVNIDAMYGLPHQSLEAVARTMEQVVALAPDRIALFGYAHVPWMKTHMRMIDEDALPGAFERFRQAQEAASILQGAGYVQIGLDHFAKPDDSLAQALGDGSLRRNFQGYTSDTEDALIGFGASAIGCLPQGYCQNEPPIGRYAERIAQGELATVKGVALEPHDRTRRWVIEEIMCRLAFSGASLRQHHGDDLDGILDDLGDMERFERDGLIARTEDGFEVTEKGRPFVRVICAHFDTYLKRAKAKHSTAV